MKRKPSEADRLTALLNEAASAPQASPEVLVPGNISDWLGARLKQARGLASTPSLELLGSAEKLVLRQTRRLLKAKAEYGISLGGLVRGGALFLLSFPRKRQDR